jgi:hypothetical protein
VGIINTLGEVFPTVLAGVAFIVWLIRLEGRMNAHEEIDTLRFENIGLRQDHLDKEQDEIKQKHEKLEGKIIDKLSVIEKTLSKIEGRLSIDMDNKD